MKRILAAAALFAALLSSCNNAPKGAPEHKIAITAHRGYWLSGEANGAQNSIESLKAAQAIDVWGSEFDVQLTADDVMMVNHDEIREGLLIWDNPWSEFEKMKLSDGERPSTLDEYLSQGEKDKCVLVCELKYQKTTERGYLLADLAVDALKRHNLFDPSRVIFISFSYEICKHLAGLAPGFTIQYLSGDKDPDTLIADGINGMDYYFSVFTEHPEWVARAHELGMSVNAWTVDRADDIQSMIDVGVDCITTNYPLRTRELLGAKELRK